MCVFVLLLVPGWQNSPTPEEPHDQPWARRSHSSRIFRCHPRIPDSWGRFLASVTTVCSLYGRVCYLRTRTCERKRDGWCNRSDKLGNWSATFGYFGVRDKRARSMLMRFLFWAPFCTFFLTIGSCLFGSQTSARVRYAGSKSWDRLYLRRHIAGKSHFGHVRTFWFYFSGRCAFLLINNKNWFRASFATPCWWTLWRGLVVYVTTHKHKLWTYVVCMFKPI